MKVDFGDYTTITGIFNKGKKKEQRVSISYVRRVIVGDALISPGSTAQEILQIATKYITTKKKWKRELIAA